MRRRLLLAPTALLAVAAMALLAAGCGGGGDSSTSTAASSGAATSSSTTTPAQGGSSVDVSETEFKLNPPDPSVKAGQVTFNVSNDGQTVHSLEVEGPNGEQSLPSDLSPCDKGTLTVDLSKPGKYEFYCPVANHKQMGMEGEITVK
jgi:uncharacterized cupredoxin-like copper-binding protein